ncbi:MAG: type II toxin-antitoxin system RelE/ParE family toxin [Alphaproteobacteria bacterium]|nr:type II toxin-antitoxin system RelE/ParE family toxin [Alphaproteobacteria bacterium]
MPPNWILSPAAAQDIRRIAEKSRQDWGLDHSIAYAEALFAALDRVAQYPDAGRHRDDLKAGVRSWPIRSHVLFYRVLDGRVEVARVLHHRQDPQRAFG